MTRIKRILQALAFPPALLPLLLTPLSATALVAVFQTGHTAHPLAYAAKAVSLTTASVSMLSLETAMLSAFGNENKTPLRQVITALSGIAVCLFVLGMAVFMITHASKKLKTLPPKGDQHGKP